MDSPKCILIFGLPGSGKSYFAQHLSEKRGIPWLNSDRIRKEMFPAPTYTQQEKDSVYERLFELLGEHLQQAKEVILDATFYRKELRDHVQHRAEALGCSCHWIEVWADETISRGRLSQPRVFSDADYRVYTRIKETFEPMSQQHLRVQSTNDNIEEMLQKAEAYLDHE